MLQIQHALFLFFFIFSVSMQCPIQQRSISSGDGGSSSRMACSCNPKVSSIYGTEWTLYANRIQCALHTFHHKFFALHHSKKPSSCVLKHFNEENFQLYSFFSGYAQKLRTCNFIHVRCKTSAYHYFPLPDHISQFKCIYCP